MERYFALCILFLLFLFVKQVSAQPVGLFQVCEVINWGKNILTAFIIMGVIMAGYKLMSSTGDPKSIEDAKKTIIITLIGGVLIWLSFNITKAMVGNLCCNYWGGRYSCE